MNDIDVIMSKVFKREHENLDKFQDFFKQAEISEQEMLDNFSELLGAYNLLLQDAVKITKISDINLKKLFCANDALEQQKKKLYLASIIDPMLDIHNRTYLMQVLLTELAKSKRYQHIFSCILIDIDDFKKINDTYGHQMGDQLLIRIADIVKKELREVDCFGRYGGEEFLIILPSTNANEALQAAEKLRIKIANNEFKELSNALSFEHSITISLGISQISLENPQSDDELLHQADTALYQAKHLGKNRSVIYQHTSEEVFQP